ncbi:DMT family transporter [Taibaiella soli]|uniref:EamA-like transporter family protein n=1 Tax=Taibaiella soli TaxID=1649169 RepID=A0A2W2AMY4_9BACT|nr:DMT family transporter [Taibaiella soli]PZF73690.1 EamA-like transporter family protein [Taibaiella soli]
MRSDILFLVLALITGALIPIQAATNAAFSKSVGNATITTLMVLIVGLIGMFVFALLSRVAIPTRQQLAEAPGYSYLGGLIVATYIIMITILVPRIGVGTSIGLIVTGQIICAVVIDHFGLFKTTVQPVNVTRLAGMILMILGVYLIMKRK